MVLPSVVESQFVILTEHGIRQDIALTYGFEATPREANARLIASAPELLTWLRLFIKQVPEQSKATWQYEQALATIAKATGSTS